MHPEAPVVPVPDLRRLMTRLRFRHLQLLIALRDTGSLRSAATELSLTQPALSKALGEIESAFGFALFERSARGLTATPRGRLIVQSALRIRAELAHASVEASAVEPLTVLRIGAPPFIAHGHLPRVLARLRRQHPRVQLQLTEERVPQLLQLLQDGQLDALVTSFPAELQERSGSSLQAHKLFDADYAVIAPARHPIARLRRVGWARLAQEPWIMPGRTALTRGILELAFHREGLAPPVPVIESTNPVTNMQMTAAGLGLSVVPEATWSAARAHRGVRRLPVSPPLSSGPVALIHRVGPDDARLSMLREALGTADPAAQ